MYLAVIKSEKFEARFFGRFVPFYLHIGISHSSVLFLFFLYIILSKIVIFDNQTFIASLRGGHKWVHTFLHLLISDATLPFARCRESHKMRKGSPLYPRTKSSGTMPVNY